MDTNCQHNTYKSMTISRGAEDIADGDQLIWRQRQVQRDTADQLIKKDTRSRYRDSYRRAVK